MMRSQTDGFETRRCHSLVDLFRHSLVHFIEPLYKFRLLSVPEEIKDDFFLMTISNSRLIALPYRTSHRRFSSSFSTTKTSVFRISLL